MNCNNLNFYDFSEFTEVNLPDGEAGGSPRRNGRPHHRRQQKFYGGLTLNAVSWDAMVGRGNSERVKECPSGRFWLFLFYLLQTLTGSTTLPVMPHCHS